MNLNNVAFLLVVVACLWAIVDRHVSTGIVGTVGLLLVACGCLAELDDGAYTLRAFAMVAWGLVLVAAGVFWRFTGRRWWSSWCAAYAIDVADLPVPDRRSWDRRGK